VGNIMGGTVFLNLLSTIANGNLTEPKRVGIFSYGSGCCSEFYSGVVTEEGQRRIREMGVEKGLDDRHELEIEQYLQLVKENDVIAFGTRNVELGLDTVPELAAPMAGSGRLILRGIKEFHREYEWV
jgi:polyketide biosynthesis 3-hydroxy-3-methylglutaryl-CoA synthase-like enzyme PksG